MASIKIGDIYKEPKYLAVCNYLWEKGYEFLSDLFHFDFNELFHLPYLSSDVIEDVLELFFRKQLESLPLSNRATYALRRGGLFTLSDLLLTNEKKLKKTRNIGKKTLKEIMDFQEQYIKDNKAATQKLLDGYSALEKQATKVKELPLSKNAKRLLTKLNVISLNDLLALDYRVLEKSKYVRQNTIEEIAEFIRSYKDF